MLKELGMVEDVMNKEVVVRLSKGEHCQTCPSKGMCHLGHDEERLVKVKTDIKLLKGQVVEIGIPEGELLKLSFLVYFLPILSLMVFSTLAYYLLPQMNIERSLASFIIGLSGLFFTYLPLRKLDKARRSSSEKMPRVLRVIPPSCSR